jgi:hypothetical protein
MPLLTMKTFTLLIAILLASSEASVSNLPNMRYCSHINLNTGDGAEGWFAMEIDQATSTAKYKFEIDFSAYTGTCNVSKGVKYHIHSSWASPEGASTSQCGAVDTGAHYDPTFACGPASAYADSNCVSLQRTATFGYEYNCSSSQFMAGNFPICELGDLSGKFGYAQPINLVMSSGVLKDPLGPYVIDYNAKWLSIVWHCMDSNDDRFLCARLKADDDPNTYSACLENGGYDEEKAGEGNDKGVVGGYTRAQLVEGIIISIILSVALTLVCYASTVFCGGKEPAKNTTIVVHPGTNGTSIVQQPYAPEVQPRTSPPFNPIHRI